MSYYILISNLPIYLKEAGYYHLVLPDITQEFQCS